MDGQIAPLSDLFDRLVVAAEGLAGDALWSREEGRALSALVEDLRRHAADAGFALAPDELPAAMRDWMEQAAA